MTAPVEVFPGDTLMLSRKITEDWFLLKPTPTVKMLVGFMVLYWAELCEADVLAVIILGNHLHIIYRHRTGKGPLLCQMMLHWIARILNRRLGRTGRALFAAGPCRPMRLLTPADVEANLDYVVVNAVRHGLCEKAYSWPGLLFGPEDVGQTVVYQRPPELSASPVFPAEVRQVVQPPEHLRQLPAHAIAAKFAERRRAIERQEYQKRKGRFMGVERAMQVPKFSRPKKPKKSTFNPFFKSCDPSVRADAARSRAAFVKSHRARLAAFRAGDRESHWPPGTYKMRVTYGLPP